MHDDVLAFFISWSCYGTYLPGDARGWTKWHKGEQLPQPLLADWCRDRMAEEPLRLDGRQRAIVEQAIHDHCTVRGWKLLAVNCRTTHCHVVVAAADYDGEQVRDQLKAWATRRLNQDRQQNAATQRRHWWTR